jgi:hypothetical protein
MFKDSRIHGAAELSLLVGDVIYADSIRGKGQTSYFPDFSSALREAMMKPRRVE